MARRQLYRDLNDVRGLVADALARLEEISGSAEEYWVRSALARVRGMDGMLVAASGGLSGWSRTLISAVLAFPLLWAVAWASAAIGAGSLWVIVITVLALGVAMPGLLWVTGRISRLVDGRRMGAGPRAGEAGKGDLDEVIEVLVRARVRLVSAALRQVGSRRWDAARLARLARTDRAINRIADADMLLCQAIDFLEIHAAEQQVRRAA
ncbi:hypothetical protein BJ973_008809 [Actinoplanes tereljensis]|uniref:Uncharacterized protein n=1 Tax=Paractinoplanes tereljensis TaxID=571912 RepID=A0A919TPP8_9ACTN|nr:hypothetical protein [Actinoplanes tereljensis]GIF18228.1 hypothetical protein Ate02nite_09580 [Actinoplanes tereljensis]